MNKVLNNLGLCAKAKGLISGEDFVVEGIKNGDVFLVFLANDAAVNITKTINDKCSYYKVEIINSYSTEELSKSIGKENRKVLGITNKGFIKILK